MKKTHRMKVGFVGCGGFAQGNHIPNVADNPNFEIVGFCDLNDQILGKLKTKYNPRYVTTDMTKLVADPDVELVICSTKPDARLPIMELAAKHEKHLFVEKPMCYHESEIDPMMALTRAGMGQFMVGYNRPYSPLMQDLKPMFNRLRKGNTTIIYRIIGEAAMWPKHHYDAVMLQKESTILHEATHIFDLLNWLTDLAPTRVYTAGGGNVDNIITLNYPENITAVVISGDNGSTGYPKERIEINSNGGTIIGDNFVELWSIGVDGTSQRKEYPYTIQGEKMLTSACEFNTKLWAWRKSVTDAEQAEGYYYDRFPSTDKGHYHELEFFRQAISEGQPSQTDATRGAMASLIAWRAIDSWKEGRPIDLNF